VPWLVGALAAGALSPAAARAQMPLDGSAYAFPVPDYVGSLVGANSLDPGFQRGGKRQKKTPAHRPKPPTRRQLATLRYTPRTSVTQGVYARVLEQLGPGVDPSQLTAQLDAAKANFRAVLKKLHWSARDLGDMAAFSFVQSYVTWNEIEQVSPRGLKLLRRDVRANLARQAKVRRLSDARQQEIAEVLELRVIFFLDERNDALRAGESTAVARAEMREWTTSIFGVDVNEVRLTSRGLKER